MITASAPAKLTLSGEHAVIYGAPALATAINLDLEARVELQAESDIPIELARYALQKLSEYFNIVSADELYVHLDSNIPIGCGMGSSAAVIVAVTYAALKLLDLTIEDGIYWQMCREIENLQHGRSSGMDPYLAIHGGCYWFATGHTPQLRPLPQEPFLLVNTGRPDSTTRDCVAAVSKHFHCKSSILEDFSAVTHEFSLGNKAAIKANHRLLTHIGVVPEKVQRFINTIESQGGAAKICGAGATTGDNAGVVLVIGLDDISALLAEYNYQLLDVRPNPKGVHIVSS